VALPQEERRIAPRFKLRAPAEYQNDSVHGNGTIWDISASGARIENATASVEQGVTLGLRSSFFPGSFDVELKGDVVRHTRGGFAVQFVDLGAPQIDFLRTILPIFPPTLLPK
jgi:hypothetical protein